MASQPAAEQQQRQVLNLFQRIHEPVFKPKSGTVFTLPDAFMV